LGTEFVLVPLFFAEVGCDGFGGRGEPLVSVELVSIREGCFSNVVRLWFRWREDGEVGVLMLGGAFSVARYVVYVHEATCVVVYYYLYYFLLFLLPCGFGFRPCCLLGSAAFFALFFLRELALGLLTLPGVNSHGVSEGLTRRRDIEAFSGGIAWGLV
jgi:hypothetical protein